METMSALTRLSMIGVPALGLLALAALSSAQEERGRIAIEVCRHRAADGPGSRKVDLQAPEREHAAMAKAFRAGLASLERKTSAPKDEGYDAGLPACRQDAALERIQADALPGVFRDRPLYFLRLGKGGRLPRGLPPSLEKNAVVFVLSASSLADAAELGRSTGVQVSIGTAELARKFGVRCAQSRVEVSSDGKTLRTQEIMP
jgi:hypothetical protein